MKRLGALLLAVGLLALAALFALVAVDVLHREDSMAAGDARYAAGPSQKDLWEASEIVPLGTAVKVLGVSDDLEYRRALRLYRLSQPRTSTLVRVGLSPVRAHAEAEVTEAAAHEDDPVRRAELVNLLGVLSVARAATDPGQSGEVLQEAASAFRQAMRLDPSNANAKANLELVMRVRREQQRTPGGRGGRPPQASRVGLGDSGTGY
jgi:hypothetical protein